MIKITDDFVVNAAAFAAAGLVLPRFDVAAARAAAEAAPVWLHIGPGNLFRAFHAQLAQALLNDGGMTAGVVVAGTLWPGEINQVYLPFDLRHVTVVMNPDDSVTSELNASVAKALFVGPGGADMPALMDVFAAPSLQMVTVSITEKGYVLGDADGASSPAEPVTAMGIVAAGLHARWKAGAAPIALVSTDNFSANGERFRASVLGVVQGWADAGRVEPEFVEYVADPRRVAFPCTMIDRITPNPSQEVADKLTSAGVDGMELIRVSASTILAPFANTEPTWYLVVEDDFPNGRPPLERVGVLMADRRTVNLVDEMKVTACLNPLHTALAIFGVLLGYDRIWREMDDPDLASLVTRLGRDEMLPVCPDPGVLSPAAFLDAVLNVRLPNPSLPDMPQRIAADTSQKLPIRFGVPLRRHMDAGTDLGGLTAFPLVLAGWLRYLMGVDDAGQPVELSPDPRLAEVRGRLAGLVLGADNRDIALTVGIPLLSEVLDVDVTPLAPRIVDDLEALTRGPGAVRATLQAQSSVIPRNAGSRRLTGDVPTGVTGSCLRQDDDGADPPTREG